MTTQISAASETGLGEGVDRRLVADVSAAVDRFTAWLDMFGETSYDSHSVYATRVGSAAKKLYYRSPSIGSIAVAPMVFCDAFLPRARGLFWKRQRYPIADAHYAMAFASLADIRQEQKWLQRAQHFLSQLEATRCPGLREYGWGYPFDWETLYGTIPAGTALITTVPYVYEAFSQVWALDHNPRWRSIMESIARHAFGDYRELETSPGATSCGYTPSPADRCLVVNASAYRAFLLAKAGAELKRTEYTEAAKRNMRFVLSMQDEDGSWPYAGDGKRRFVDHIHTCFVLKSLAKAARCIGSSEAERAIDRGVQYYLGALFDDSGLPRLFARRPRLVLYRRDVYDYAECINLAVLLRERIPALERPLARVLRDLLDRWQKPDGSFRSRQLLLSWDDVPMHRWAQAQLLRSLCLFLSTATYSREATAPGA